VKPGHGCGTSCSIPKPSGWEAKLDGHSWKLQKTHEIQLVDDLAGGFQNLSYTFPIIFPMFQTLFWEGDAVGEFGSSQDPARSVGRAVILRLGCLL